jgi:hypothetical protein
MTRQEICTLLALASSSYPSMQARDPKPIVEAWAMMLADLDVVVARAAIVKVCRQSQFFPTEAQIVAAAKQLDPREEKLPTAAEAWEEVGRLIIRFGPYRAPVYSCDQVRRAAQAMGWLQLCTGDNPEADRAHFLRIYESMRNKTKDERENEKALELSGMNAAVKALAASMTIEGRGSR